MARDPSKEFLELVAATLQGEAVDLESLSPDELILIIWRLQHQQAELRQHAIRLAAMRNKFVHLYEFAPIGYVTLDAKGRIVEVNKAAAELLGRGKNDLVDRMALSAFMSETDWETFFATLQNTQDNQETDFWEALLAPETKPRHVALKSRRFTEDDGRIYYLVAMMDITAEKEAAKLSERQKLARDLHDAVSQMLFTSNLIADALPRQWESHPEKTPEQLDNLRKLNRGALAEMRALLLELRPDSLEKTPMPQLLEHLAHAIQGRAHIEVDLLTQDDNKLPEEVHVAFYRIAQESINNIIKHARANYVKIIYQARPTEVMLKIEDDGVGFDPKDVRAQSMGLKIMEERVSEVGGQFRIDTEVDGGTIITALW